LRNGNICQFGNSSPLPKATHLAHHGACFPTLSGWQTQTMKARKPLNYVRSQRLRWGLSQGELAHLLGWKHADVVSRIEKKHRPPTLKFVIACFILFGTAAAELFPDISASIEIDVMTRVWEMYERIQGYPSKKTKIKIELLEGAIARSEQRKHAPRL
jgi:transcriptional regulator with XRE-family HTH domain